jgi:hypothetical protein
MEADNLALLEDALTDHKAGNLPSALLKYRTFLKHDSGNIIAWECYSSLLLSLERHEDCIAACGRALEITPESAQAGRVLKSAFQNLLGIGIKERSPSSVLWAAKFAIGIAFGNNQAEADWELSHFKLLLGDFEAGLPMYESRLVQSDFVGHKELLASAPMWDGKPYPGQTLLIHSEQGLGDTIMMLRYLEQAKALGGTLLLGVQDPLTDIARTCAGPDNVFGKEDGIRFNLQLPIMSLPHVLKTRLENIPSKIPYIQVPKNVPNMPKIDARIAETHGRKRHGLVWAGRPTHMRDHERSIEPKLLRPLEAVEGVAWFCLQKDAPEAKPFRSAVPLGDLLETFADTAYALSQMDLLVTVDTAVAHLAGAMGVPVKLMATFLPDWRWMLWRADSPWYPSMEIYRQQNAGSWDAVIQSIADDCMASATKPRQSQSL